jgi:hypothetical protein
MFQLSVEETQKVRPKDSVDIGTMRSSPQIDWKSLLKGPLEK